MPLCHGAGGLAGQYYFGARTGGTNVIEGLIEIVLGIFLAGSIAAIFTVFPLAIIGSMIFLVSIELVKFGRHLRPNRQLLLVAATVLGSLMFNVAAGFFAGLAVHYLTYHKQGDSGGIQSYGTRTVVYSRSVTPRGSKLLFLEPVALHLVKQ